MVHNPLQVLCEIVGRLHDAIGRVAIPGFHDRVRIWYDEERYYMAQTGPTEKEFLRGAQVVYGRDELHYASFALPDDRMHEQREAFFRPNFLNGIATSISFLSEVAPGLKSIRNRQRAPQKMALRA